MNLLNKISILVLCSLALTSVSCDDGENPIPINEIELITTVTATFVPDGGGSTITLRMQDLDGEGGNAPVTTVSGNFTKNKTYRGSLTFLNEIANPPIDVTQEIKKEDDEHQAFYITTGSLNALTYATSSTNFDSNGLPLGLQSVFITTGAASGTLTITLRHGPNKKAAGVSSGNITNAGGATDASVTFSIVVE